MATKRILPAEIQAGRSAYRLLADRMEDLLGEGTLAERPDAKGSKRLYFATDTNLLYYDKGSWVLI